MRRGIGRVVRHVMGWGMLALGVAGLVLPVLQGWLFIAIGALILARDMPFFARLLDRIERRFPLLRHPIARARAWLGPPSSDQEADPR